jgi:ATP-binding cassette subfamily F protein 3
VTRAEKLAVGYFAQHQLDELNPRESAYDHFRHLLPEASVSAVRARVGAIGFPGARADTPAGELSGGEKARLLLGLATIAKPHLIILDEPTNHLDIDSRAALIEALNDYAGAVILISHDRHLLEACVDRLWIVRDGTVAPFEGDMEEYSRLIVGRKTSEASVSNAPQAPRESRGNARRAAADKRAELAPLRKRIAGYEADIARLSANIKHIDATLSDGDLYASDPQKAAQLSKRRAEATEALQVAEEAWLDASAQYEAEIG